MFRLVNWTHGRHPPWLQYHRPAHETDALQPLLPPPPPPTPAPSDFWDAPTEVPLPPPPPPPPLQHPDWATHESGYNLTGCATSASAPASQSSPSPVTTTLRSRLGSPLTSHRSRTSANTGRPRHWRSHVTSTESSCSRQPRTVFMPRRSRTPRTTSHSCAHYCHARLINGKRTQVGGIIDSRY